MAPKLLMIVGLHYSGKSSLGCLLEKSLSNWVLLDVDNLRPKFYGREFNFKCEAAFWKWIQLQIYRCLKKGKSVILVSTAPTVNVRKPYKDLCLKVGAKLFAVSLTAPLSVILERASVRQRKIPQEIINEFVAKFTLPTIDEGFAFVWNFDTSQSSLETIAKKIVKEVK